jgi:hypothetical protein
MEEKFLAKQSMELQAGLPYSLSPNPRSRPAAWVAARHHALAPTNLPRPTTSHGYLSQATQSRWWARQALRKRTQTGRDELKKQRQLDLERLLQRYQNVKSELEAQQNIERIRADRYFSHATLKKSAANAPGSPNQHNQSFA